MMMNRQITLTLQAVRTLVRYVDEDQAVIEIVFSVADWEQLAEPVVDLHVRLKGPRGRVIDCQGTVALQHGAGVMRFEIDEPRRWWPAGMGEQELYEFSITLLAGDEAPDRWSTTLGMTSVRTAATRTWEKPTRLLINGRRYEFHSILPIERADEQSVLPVAGDSLLLVRDHFGPDVLYDAADRAGILLIQSVPLTRRASRNLRVHREVDRLAAHPSLAGWLVDGAGRVGDRMARRLAHLDPTRKVFREFPCAS